MSGLFSNNVKFLAIFDRLRSILNDSDIDKRIQYMIEVIFHIRKDKFQVFFAIFVCNFVHKNQMELHQRCSGENAYSLLLHSKCILLGLLTCEVWKFGLVLVFWYLGNRFTASLRGH